MNISLNQKITAGFFGKLPRFADFVKMNSSGLEITQLDNWIQEGLAAAKLKYKNDWKVYFESSAPINFIFPFNESGRTVSGVLKPARDKIGRQFPFIFFTISEVSQLTEEPLHLSVVNKQNLFLQINKTLHQNFESENLDGIRTFATEFSLNNSNYYPDSINYNDYINSLSIQKFFDLNEMGTDNNNDFEINFLLKSRIIYPENTAGIGLIFSASEEEQFHSLGFAIEMLITIFSKQGILPSIFWKRINSNECIVFLFFQKPKSSDFYEMIYESSVTQQLSERNQSQDSYKLLKKELRINRTDNLFTLISLIKSANN
jgi:type VI secretion system ImpM family protein